MGQYDQNDQLFAALTQQLRTPLLQIARLSELQNAHVLPKISTISEYALLLVDAYVQACDQQQTKLDLEPINTNAVLYDVAALLEPIAKTWDYRVEVQNSKGTPVMVHASTLRTMLALLGASLMEVGSTHEKADHTIVLGAHKSEQGMVIGAFSKDNDISQQAIQLARSLHGRASQAAPGLTMSGSAGLAIADRLSEQLDAPLKAHKHNSLTGIGSLLLPSRQLQLLS